MTEKKIVVGVDGSEPSKAALRWAARAADITGSRIDAVIAWQTPAMYGWTMADPHWHPDRDAEKVIAATVDEVFGSDRPHDLRMIVEEGNAAKVLLDASKDAELLIVGSRGRGGFVGLLLGSVSASCAEHASCPVLVVHDRGPQ